MPKNVTLDPNRQTENLENEQSQPQEEEVTGEDIERLFASGTNEAQNTQEPTAGQTDIPGQTTAQPTQSVSSADADARREQERKEREQRINEQAAILQKLHELEEERKKKEKEEEDRRRAEEEERKKEEKKKKEEEEQKKKEEEERKKKEEEHKYKQMLEKDKLLQSQVGMTKATVEDLPEHKKKVNGIMDGIDEIDPNYVRSSDAFKYIKGSLEEVKRLGKDMVLPATAKELRHYAKAYQTLAEDTDFYLEHKKDDKNPSKLARKRINFVKEKKKFAEANRDFWKEQYKESLKIGQLDSESIDKNTNTINDFVDDLDDVDPFYVSSSDEFKQVKSCLKDVQTLAKKMKENPSEEDMRKYMLANKRLNKACDNYTKVKGDPQNAREVRRLDMVNDLKEFSEINGQDFERIAQEKGYNITFTEEELQFDYEKKTEKDLEEKNPELEEEERDLENTEEIDLEQIIDEQEVEPQPENIQNQADDEFEVLDNDFWEREYGEMAKLKGIDKDSLKQNAQMLKEFSDEIDKLDGKIFKAPAEYQKMKKSISELKKLGEEMADDEAGEPTKEQLEAYQQKSKEVTELTDAYLEADSTKKNLEKNDKDTLKRTEQANKMKECLKLNQQSVEKVQEDMALEEQAELEAQQNVSKKDEETIKKEKEAAKYSEKTDLRNDACRKNYMGNQDPRQMNNPHRYAVTTNAVQALGEMYLMASGNYTLEQIVNPDALKEQKAAAGNEVMKHIKGGTEDDQKWLAATIYQGSTKGLKMMDEYAADFNVADPTFMQSEECANLGHMCQTMNAGIKAMDNCKEELVAVVKEIDNKDINFKNFQQDLKDKVYLPNALTSSARDLHENVVNSEKNPDNNLFKSYAVEHAIRGKVIRDIVDEAQRRNPEAPLSGLVKGKENIQRVRDVVNGVSNDVNVEEFTSKLPKNKDIYDKNLGNIVNGKMFKNMKVTAKDGEVKVHNLPSVEEVQKDQEFSKMSDVKMNRIIEEQNRKNDRMVASGKITNQNQLDVMERAKDSRVKLAQLSNKEGELTKAEMKLAKIYMKEIVAEKFVIYAANNNIPLNPDATDYTSGVGKLPAFKKETSYISQGSIKQFLAEDKGGAMIKDTIVEQKQALDEQKAMEAEMLLQQQQPAAALGDDQLQQNLSQNQNQPDVPRQNEPLEPPTSSAPAQAPVL